MMKTDETCFYSKYLNSWGIGCIKGAAALYMEDVSCCVYSVSIQVGQRLSKRISLRTVCVCVLVFLWNQSLLALSAQGPHASLFSEIVINGQVWTKKKNPVPQNNKIHPSFTPSFFFLSLTSPHVCTYVVIPTSINLGWVPWYQRRTIFVPLGCFSVLCSNQGPENWLLVQD